METETESSRPAGRIFRRLAFPAIALAGLAAASWLREPPTPDRPAGREGLVTRVDRSRRGAPMDADWLKARGFEAETGGYVLRGARLDEVGRLLGFNPSLLQYDPGLSDDALRGVADIDGGRCIVDFLDPLTEPHDGTAHVDARVELFAPGRPRG